MPQTPVMCQHVSRQFLTTPSSKIYSGVLGSYNVEIVMDADEKILSECLYLLMDGDATLSNRVAKARLERFVVEIAGQISEPHGDSKES